ncbi:MAG: hypothetical protein ACK5HR_03280 [Mycoplasmatales bacterium]
MKFDYIYLQGKHNYNNKQIVASITEKTEAFKLISKQNMVKVIYVLDKDKFDSVLEDRKHVEKV